MNVDWRGVFYIIVYYIIIIMFLSASMVRDQVIFPSVVSELLFLFLLFVVKFLYAHTVHRYMWAHWHVDFVNHYQCKGALFDVLGSIHVPALVHNRVFIRRRRIACRLGCGVLILCHS